ncbi:hypothetical protein TNCV_2440411 [Trichonephila clavipes]|nr:hypothetical protein TNCV_2440411 [Trichonephila clavipes]
MWNHYQNELTVSRRLRSGGSTVISNHKDNYLYLQYQCNRTNSTRQLPSNLAKSSITAETVCKRLYESSRFTKVISEHTDVISLKTLQGHGSRVVSDRGLPCQEFKLGSTKGPPFRAAMNVKSVERSNVLLLVGCGVLVSNDSEFYKCIEFGSQECNMKNSVIVYKGLKDLAEVCTKGSSKNALYQKHKDCLFRKAPMFLKHCHELLVKEILEIPNHPKDKYRVEVSKINCKWIDKVEDCVERTVQQTCGEEALKLRSYFATLTTNIYRGICILAKESQDEL